MANRLRASWGVTDRVTGVSGVVVGIDFRAEGSFITETDLYGTIVAVFMHDEVYTFGVDVMVGADATMPNRGTQMSVAGEAAYVKDAQITESNASYQKMHITLEKTARVSSLTGSVV